MENHIEAVAISACLGALGGAFFDQPIVGAILAAAACVIAIIVQRNKEKSA